MITEPGYGEGQGADHVGCRQVLGPEERFAAQLDRRGEEGEHGDEYRHLKQHRQASREGRRSGLGVEGHRFLLAGHGVLVSGILVVDFLYLRSEHTHFGLRHIALVGEWEEDDFYKEGEQQDYDAVVGYEAAQECEHRDYNQGVDPAEEGPAKRDEACEFKRRVILRGFELRVESGEERVEVRPHEDVDGHGHLLGGSIVHCGLGREVLEIAGGLPEVHGSHLGRGEGGARNHHGGEELVFERNPFQALVEALLLVALHGKVIGRVAQELVEQPRVALLESAPALVAGQFLGPHEVGCRHRGGDDFLHTALHHLHAHHV